jgi:hypothetical protein
METLFLAGSALYSDVSAVSSFFLGRTANGRLHFLEIWTGLAAINQVFVYPVYRSLKKEMNWRVRM